MSTKTSTSLCLCLVYDNGRVFCALQSLQQTAEQQTKSMTLQFPRRDISLLLKNIFNLYILKLGRVRSLCSFQFLLKIKDALAYLHLTDKLSAVVEIKPLLFPETQSKMGLQYDSQNVWAEEPWIILRMNSLLLRCRSLGFITKSRMQRFLNKASPNFGVQIPYSF